MKYLPEDYHLCLVGDGERRAEFETLVKELGLEQRVHLLGLRSDVPEVLATSDYVVMCSHYEGLSLSSLEGMASGKPFWQIMWMVYVKLLKEMAFCLNMKTLRDLLLLY